MHNHIKITTKLHNNHHSKPPETELNVIATTVDLKKKPHKTGWRHRTDWSHIHVWWIKIRRDISGVRDSIPTLGPPRQGFRARKVSPHKFWSWKPVGIAAVDGRNSWGSRQLLLSGRTCTWTYLHSLPLSSSERAAAWKAPETWEGIELSSIRVRAEGAAFSQTEMMAEAIVLLQSPLPTEPAGKHHIWDSINLAHTVAPSWWFPAVPPHPTFGPAQAICGGFYIWMPCLGSYFRFS